MSIRKKVPHEGAWGTGLGRACSGTCGACVLGGGQSSSAESGWARVVGARRPKSFDPGGQERSGLAEGRQHEDDPVLRGTEDTGPGVWCVEMKQEVLWGFRQGSNLSRSPAMS